jgi:hypothetical protein
MCFVNQYGKKEEGERAQVVELQDEGACDRDTVILIF